GSYRLSFEDVKASTLTGSGAVGPFTYTLSPAMAAPVDQVVAGSIATARQVDLYRLAGQAGRTLTLSAYWGGDDYADFGFGQEGGLDGAGLLRLYGPDGALLAAPDN